MKKHLFLITLLLGIPSFASPTAIVANPVKHFIDTHQIDKNSKIMFFEIDVNGDKKPDLFISSTDKKFNNGQAGNIYLVYLTKGDKYLWESKNNISLHYNKLIFNNGIHKKARPLIFIEKDSLWMCSFLGNRKNEFKLADITWGKDPRSSDIFHDLINKSNRKNHPLRVVDKNRAIAIWKQLKTK